MYQCLHSVPKRPTDIHHPVAGGDDAHVMPDHDHCIPCRDQQVQLPHQSADIDCVQSCRWFVENIERSATLYSLQLGRELNPLRLADNPPSNI
jgi:hypothetical protein